MPAPVAAGVVVVVVAGADDPWLAENAAVEVDASPLTTAMVAAMVDSDCAVGGCADCCLVGFFPPVIGTDVIYSGDTETEDCSASD